MFENKDITIIIVIKMSDLVLIDFIFFAKSVFLICIVCVVQSCCGKHHLTEVSVGLIFGQSREATSVCIVTMFTRVIF